MADSESVKAMKDLWDTVVNEKQIGVKHKNQGVKDAATWIAKKFPKKEGGELFKLFESQL
jgi:uncharacterized protein (DUF2164 family)